MHPFAPFASFGSLFLKLKHNLEPNLAELMRLKCHIGLVQQISQKVDQFWVCHSLVALCRLNPFWDQQVSVNCSKGATLARQWRRVVVNSLGEWIANSVQK